MHASVGNEPIWKLEHVSLGPTRLRDVSLEIGPGMTALIGWSGAGKTSLLNLLVGFEKPQRGRISSSKSELAWVPQNGGLWPHCTAREHLAIASRGGANIDLLLADFDLQEKAHSRPDELSEGEQSRLSVARALAMEAQVLVMDEPLVHVDPARAGKYWKNIREQVNRTGASLVFSTHVPETVLGEAQWAICLREGSLLFAGPVPELYARPASSELMSFLGPGNWFTPPEALCWLGIPLESERCFRPEEITISPAAAGPFVVEAARFCGSVGQVTLRAQGGRPPREFFHRPSAGQLKPGINVAINLANGSAS